MKLLKEARLGGEQQMRFSLDRLIVARRPVVFGDFLKRWLDEVARYQLSAPVLMSQKSVMRVRRFSTSEVPLTQSDELE